MVRVLLINRYSSSFCCVLYDGGDDGCRVLIKVYDSGIFGFSRRIRYVYMIFLVKNIVFMKMFLFYIYERKCL